MEFCWPILLVLSYFSSSCGQYHRQHAPTNNNPGRWIASLPEPRPENIPSEQVSQQLIGLHQAKIPVSGPFPPQSPYGVPAPPAYGVPPYPHQSGQLRTPTLEEESLLRQAIESLKSAVREEVILEAEEIAEAVAEKIEQDESLAEEIDWSPSVCSKQSEVYTILILICLAISSGASHI